MKPPAVDILGQHRERVVKSFSQKHAIKMLVLKVLTRSEARNPQWTNLWFEITGQTSSSPNVLSSSPSVFVRDPQRREQT